MTFDYDGLERLLRISGVSGYEENVSACISDDLRRLGLSPNSDPLGNLWVEMGVEKRPSVAILAHLDEVGFVVSGIDPDGIVWLQPLGYWILDALFGMPMTIHGRNGDVPGVVAAVPSMCQEPFLGVDVGVESAEEVAALGVEVLQPATMLRFPQRRFGKMVVGRGLDNRLGCQLLIDLTRVIANERLDGRLVLAWTAQEEVGFRGTLALRSELGPIDAVYSVDAYRCDRRSGGPTTGGHPRLGMGPVLREIDKEGVGTRSLEARVVEASNRLGVSLQRASSDGNNQASVFVDARKTALDLPVAYPHSSVEAVYESDIVAIGQLLEYSARNLREMSGG